VWPRLRNDAVMRLLQRLVREPMVHFMALGGLIFVAWWVLNPQPVRGDTRIVVSAADVQRIRVLATRQWGHAPAPQELDALVKAYVREEVLYREALASGLDRDDIVVRRRLVQKMESLAQHDDRMPSEPELKSYWAAHAGAFAARPTISFRQVFFSTDRRGQRALPDASAALKASSAGATPTGGDPLMLSSATNLQTRQTLARDYGQDFAVRVFGLPAGSWQGPVPSALGVHLVYVEPRDNSRPDTDFATVRDQVLQDWLDRQQTAAQEAAYQQMRTRYHVEVDASGLAAAGARP